MARHGSAQAEQPSPAPAATGTTRTGGLATWPIRQKLAALVAVPTLLAIGLIVSLVVQSFLAWRHAEQADKAAEVLITSNNVVSASNIELQQSLAVLLNKPDAQADLDAARAATDEAIATLNATLEDAPEQQWLPATRDRAEAVRTTLPTTVPSMRELASDPAIKQATVAQAFDVSFQSVRDLSAALSTELGALTPNPRTADSSAVLSAVAGTASRASQEIVLLTNALHENQANLPTVNDIEEAAAGQSALLDFADSRASAAQKAKITDIRALDSKLQAARGNGIEIARRGSGTPSAQADQDALAFATTAGQRLTMLDEFTASTSADLKAQTSSDASSALLRLGFLTGLGLLSLALVIGLVSYLASSITAPMRRLRSGAVDAATVRLPAAVRQIVREGPDAHVVVPPVLAAEAKVGPETREVAQALDGLTGEAIRLATAQVRLRQSLDEAFVSMSRRSQAMVEKQLAIIDELESQEEDAEQLRNLFRLDHLAARMRRYNDNLLVLAGSAVRTRSAAPVAVSDVFRAATSEMEQYERVRLQPLSNASVAGAASGGLIHLLAELLDNAAMYSPPTSPIVLSAAFTEEGGLRLEVTDAGVGIPPAEIEDLNARLSAPGTIDMQVPSRMGLYVVARLAQRGGLAVRLRSRAEAAGTIAEVIVPKNQVLGAPTGPLSTIPDAPPLPSLPAQPTRLPQQHNGLGAAGGERAEEPQANRPVVAFDRDSWATPPRQDEPSVATAQSNSDEAARSKGSDDAGEIVEVEPAHEAPPAISGTGGGGLPSRRPGAALAGNPLGEIANQGASPAAKATSGPGSALPTRSNAAMGASARAGETAERPADHEIDLTESGLPRRSPGMTHRTATPFADQVEPEPQVRAPFEPPPRADSPPTPSAGTPILPSSAPGHRPGARPLPVRAPGQPGGGPAIGSSAATAVAAAAAARPRPQLSGSGLFAATGPLIEGARNPAGRVPGSDGTGRSNGSGADRNANGTSDGDTGSVQDAEQTSKQSKQTSPNSDAERDETAAPATAKAGQRTPPATSGSPKADQSEASAFETEARTVAASRYRPATPGAPMVGQPPNRPDRAQTPIFDSISVWFSDDPKTSSRGAQPAQVIDLRESGRSNAPDRSDQTSAALPTREAQKPLPTRRPGGAGRWASLGDQRWVAANARAAAAPQTAGSTTTGLPRRRPGANLLPSAAAAAGSPTAAVSPPARRTDAESVRGRLGSYQRGLASARKARHLPEDDGAPQLFTSHETESTAGRQGGDS